MLRWGIGEGTMSTENVALMLQAMMDDAELLERISAAEATLAGWASVGDQFGYEFSADDFHQFVCQLVDDPSLSAEDSMEALLAGYQAEEELEDEQLEQAAGGRRFIRGRSFRFSGKLYGRMKAIGFPMAGGGAGGFARTVVVRDDARTVINQDLARTVIV